MARVNLICLDVDAFLADNVNGAGRGLDAYIPFFAFDDTTDEAIYSKPFQLPAFTGTLKVDLGYKMASATSGNVVWMAALEAVAEGDALNWGMVNSFDADNSVTDAVPGTAGNPGTATIALTSNDSAAANDWVRLKITRNADSGSDSATGDAHLLSATLFAE